MVPNRSQRFQTVPFGSAWFRTVPLGSLWFRTVPLGSLWFRPMRVFAPARQDAQGGPSGPIGKDGQAGSEKNRRSATCLPAGRCENGQLLLAQWVADLRSFANRCESLRIFANRCESLRFVPGRCRSLQTVANCRVRLRFRLFRGPAGSSEESAPRRVPEAGVRVGFFRAAPGAGLYNPCR